MTGSIGNSEVLLDGSPTQFFLISCHAISAANRKTEKKKATTVTVTHSSKEKWDKRGAMRTFSLKPDTNNNQVPLVDKEKIKPWIGNEWC